MPRRTRPFRALLPFAGLVALVLAVAPLTSKRGRHQRPEPAGPMSPGASRQGAVTARPADVVSKSPEPAASIAIGMHLPDVLIDPSVLVEKAARRLSVLSQGVPVTYYRIELVGDPVGPKTRAGDGRTPEGSLYVCAKSGSPPSSRSITLSYPGRDDADRGLAEGLIGPREHRAIVAGLRRMGCPPSRTALGGGVRLQATETAAQPAADGGIRLADADLAELFDAIPLGTSIDIVP